MSRLGADLTLDQIDAWFQLGKTVKIQTAPRSKLGGRELNEITGAPAIHNRTQFIPPYKRHSRINNPNQTAYAAHYQQLDRENMRQSARVQEAADDDDGTDSLCTMERLETASTMTAGSCITYPEGMDEEDAVKVYNNYNFRHQYNQDLAIYPYQEEIVSTIESNQVVVIQGETGCGKTTQVPQFILDHYASQQRYCNIIVTQPRRIAAMSISRRVCDERRWQHGSICGHQVAMDKKANEDTRILYCTTGVLLQKLVNLKTMSNYTHVILDEVHDREEESDFCMLVVRKLLASNSRDTKVVVMSATLNSSEFASYFSVLVRGCMEPAPVLKIKGRCYEVSEYYAEDLQVLGEIPFPDLDHPKISNEAYDLAAKLIIQFDKLEITQHGSGDSNLSSKRGSVLVFLPGILEINNMREALLSIGEKAQLYILPLHSSITGEEQSRVFEKPAPGMRKVILSTNIAESSITVSDVKFVVDFCLTKVLICDSETNYTSLQINWASKSNCIQRKGRAGRVSNGRVYRLVTKSFYQQLQDSGIPEMERCSLEGLVLQAKVLDLGEPKAILGLAMSPPNLDDIERTVLILKQIGALGVLPNGVWNPHDGMLTFLGRVLAQLPVDIRLGKLMMLGHVFGVLEDTIIIAASLSLKSFFATPYKSYLEAYRHKFQSSNESYSDPIAYLTVYKLWNEKKRLGQFHTKRSELNWGVQYFIQIRRIQEVSELVDDLTRRLERCNIRALHSSTAGDQRMSPEDHQFILKMVLAGAFFPNYFLQGSLDEEQSMREMSGRNPYTTVLVKGLPQNEGALYRRDLEKMFSCCDSDHKPKIHFEETRAFIEFVRNPIMRKNTGQVLEAVYLAVKMKQLRLPLEIQLLDSEVVMDRMKQLHLMQETQAKSSKRLKTNRVKAISDGMAANPSDKGCCQVDLPSAKQTVFPIYITEVLTCGHFWCHYADTDTFRALLALQEDINRFGGKNLQPLNKSEIRVGTFCLAPYVDQTLEYYRARIEKVYGDLTEVFFLDYGNVAQVRAEEIRVIHPNQTQLPFQAFECELCMVKPSAIKCSYGKWTKDASEEFINMLKHSDLFASIYSILYGVVRIDLYKKLSNGQDIHINQKLIDMGFADRAEECLASKQNNEDRKTEALLPSEVSESLYSNETQWSELSHHAHPTTTSAAKRRFNKIKLSGPWSPLEMNFSSMTYSCRQRVARISRDSVNSVALSERLASYHFTMMVAAHVGLDPSGGIMVARDTTMMPSLPGLPALVSLLFSPSAELRTDRKRTRYIGALCGLGWDSNTGGASLPDYDMELTFDTEFDVEDLAMINSVRIAINIGIGSEEPVADWGPNVFTKIQKTTRRRLLDLFKKKRETVEPESYHRPYQWNQIPEDEVLHPQVEEMPEGKVLLNLHSGVVLQEESEDEDDEIEDEERYGRILYRKLAQSHQLKPSS